MLCINSSLTSTCFTLRFSVTQVAQSFLGSRHGFPMIMCVEAAFIVTIINQTNNMINDEIVIASDKQGFLDSDE